MKSIELDAGFDDKIFDNSNSENVILKITKNANLPFAKRSNFALILDKEMENVPAGFDLGINFLTEKIIKNAINLSSELNYLSDGDVIKINRTSKRVRVLFRAQSRFNFFLLTERCNHYCLMCSQPPRDIQDDWHYHDVMRSIELIDRGAPFIGFTGGEPTLLGDGFVEIIRKLNGWLPETSALVLSNGRKFADPNFSDKLASIGHRDLTIAIPLYSDVSHIHDYVVQSDGAFEETIKGILRLKERRQKVQIRIVIHKQTYARLPQFAEFIYRNLAFVDHVALMGLEITGFTKANLKDLWIDPVDYSEELESAAGYLSRMGMNISIFNHQLCTIPRTIWHLAVKSISDWKNNYEPECSTCSVKSNCGGFFTTSKGKTSRAIQAQI